jgi:3-oxoacyl-[acyl-carrier protein] reductase
MKQAGRGSIVNVSSLHGFATLDGFFPYAAAKSGLLGLTRSLALDYGPKGIRVNTVAPGFIRSAMTDALPENQRENLLGKIPAGRLGEGADVASAVVYLASREAAYVTGQTIHVNGGMIML